MALDPAVVLDNWPLFAEGAWMTLRITATAFLGGLALATLVAALSFTPLLIIRLLVMVYLAVMRGVPFIILLFLVHFGLPFAGVRLPALFTGTLALTLFASAYYAEVIRATALALPRGQWDSARCIGMSPLQAVRHVIAPQILAPSIPPLTNYTMTMIKESSILSAITVGELTYQGLIVQGNTFAPFEVFFAVAGVYWALTAAVARGARLVERRLRDAEPTGMTGEALAARYLSLEAAPR